MATTKLFVGGLAWATDDGSLQQAFGKFGTVRDAKVIMDRETGRSRGFGFVTFENEADAQEAQRGMDGVNLDGRPLRVNEANEKPRGDGDRRRADDGGGHETVKRRNSRR